MKKRLVLMLAIISVLCCLLAIGVSAENALKPQDNNNYGELSFFDESITVGRTDNQNGFSPYIAETGNTYARVVIGDGTTFYTFPTAYIYSSSRVYGRDGKTLWSYDLASLNSAMETATGTNPNWTKNNVYRIELPYNTAFLNGDGTQKFYGFSNVIEIYLQPNMTNIDTGSGINCFFHSCEKLTTIHNIDSFVFKHNNNVSGSFQNCKSLTSLTLGVSPNITKITSSMFNNCTSLVSVNVFEAFPNAKEFGASAFINCTNLKSLSANRCDGVIAFPERFWYFENSVFQNCESITAVKFTGEHAKLLQSVFHSLDSLEYIYFPRDSKLELPNCEVFSNNANLKAVAFPDDCTVIPDRGFKNCTSLMAVYLPANLDELMTNGGGQGAFAYDANLYFVEDWFNVLDESGEFLFENFEMPERPDVYYFPSTLTKLYIKDGGTGFDGNYKLNPVMVLPTGVTKLWVYDGCFYNCGTASDQKTIVMLGDMETVRFNMRDSRTVGINYVFANPADKDLSSVSVIDTSDRVCYNVTNETMYFCSTGATYTLDQWEAHPDPATFTYTTEDKHITSPKATVTTPQTCTTPEGKTYYCFCGVKTGEDTTKDPLGHENSSIVAIVYNGVNKFFDAGDITYHCDRCDSDHEEVGKGKAAAIFVFRGLSAKEVEVYGKAIIQTFAVNREAMKTYNDYSDYDVVGYGLVAATELGLGGSTEIFDNDGNVNTNKAGVVNISAREEKFDVFEIKVNGLAGTYTNPETSEETNLADIKVYCCGYCLVQIGGTVASYYASNGVVTEELSGAISYNELINAQ